MTRHDDRVSLRQMLDFAEEAYAAAKGRAREELDSDRHFFLVETRLLELVGEAARRLSQEFRDAHPDLPWLDILGMRNWLAHVYDEIETDVVWDTLQSDLPELIDRLRAILSVLPSR